MPSFIDITSIQLDTLKRYFVSLYTVSLFKHHVMDYLKWQNLIDASVGHFALIVLCTMLFQIKITTKWS